MKGCREVALLVQVKRLTTLSACHDNWWGNTFIHMISTDDSQPCNDSASGQMCHASSVVWDMSSPHTLYQVTQLWCLSESSKTGLGYVLMALSDYDTKPETKNGLQQTICHDYFKNLYHFNTEFSFECVNVRILGLIHGPMLSDNRYNKL